MIDTNKAALVALWGTSHPTLCIGRHRTLEGGVKHYISCRTDRSRVTFALTAKEYGELRGMK
jgi:hypothetical protein